MRNTLTRYQGNQPAFDQEEKGHKLEFQGSVSLSRRRFHRRVDRINGIFLSANVFIATGLLDRPAEEIFAAIEHFSTAGGAGIAGSDAIDE